MKVIKTSQIPKVPATDPLFTGGEVTRQSVVTPQISGQANLNIVNFSKGARNKFHSHTTDQVLIVTSGKGIVASDKEEVVVGVGDIIHIPAGEKHWHGATKDSAFSHLYVMGADNKTTQLEK
ncbi:MAG: cupin domain-containing protein [Chloroflexi bacterium]|nr:cupin domain-containing protein [Chloroflexota bacterium]